MSETLPGNPFAEVYENDYGISPEACATLALAYEVRTANLIAWTTSHGQRPDGQAITSRLGLDGGE